MFPGKIAELGAIPMTDPIIWTHYHQMKDALKRQRRETLELFELLVEALDEVRRTSTAPTFEKLGEMSARIAQAKKELDQE